jgi:hypothetical protein
VIESPIITSLLFGWIFRGIFAPFVYIRAYTVGVLSGRF